VNTVLLGTTVFPSLQICAGHESSLHFDCAFLETPQLAAVSSA